MAEGLTAELISVIGEDGLIGLANEFGGTRLFVPVKLGRGHPIEKAIGLEKAVALSRRLAPDYIAVPLARELRAKAMDAAGLSYARIAVRLGLTENGIAKMMKRIREADASRDTGAA